MSNTNTNNENDSKFVESFFNIPEIKSGIKEIENNIKEYTKYRDFLYKKTLIFLLKIMAPISLTLIVAIIILKLELSMIILLLFISAFIFLLFLPIKSKLVKLIIFILLSIVFTFSLFFGTSDSIGYLYAINFMMGIFISFKKVEKKYPKETNLRNEYKKKLKEKNIESFVMPRFADYIKKGLKFSVSDKFLREDGQSLVSKGILEKYNRMDERKNSVSLDYEHINQSLVRSIKLSGVRIITEKKHTRTNSKGKKIISYVTNNDCYINKIEFENPKYQIEKEIKIVKDFHNKSKILSKIGFKSKDRVTLENQDFEGEFDVYCEDQILARQVLTQDFMYRIYDYIKKFNFGRSFEFYFNKNYVYIKYDILNSTSKGDLGKSDIYKIREFNYYLNFYREIKNILSLIDDLQIYYYSKVK